MEDMWLQLLTAAESLYPNSLFASCELDALYAVLPRPWSQNVLNHVVKILEYDALIGSRGRAKSVALEIQDKIEKRFPVQPDNRIPYDRAELDKISGYSVMPSLIFEASREQRRRSEELEAKTRSPLSECELKLINKGPIKI